MNKVPLELYNIEMNDFNPEVKIANNMIQVDDLKISCIRTIRVPDDGKVYNLPPNMGKHQIIKYNDKYCILMYQFEALWLLFECYKTYAIKVGAGKINAVTGYKWEHGELTNQNYLVTPRQYWLDGFAIEQESDNCYESVHHVKQFVAASLDSDAPIEKQMLGDDVKGGIQFEIYKLGSTKCNCTINKESVNENRTLQETVLEFKTTTSNETELVIYFENKKFSFGQYFIKGKKNRLELHESKYIYVKTFTGKTISISCDLNITVWQLKQIIYGREGVSVDQQRLIFAGKQLSDGDLLTLYGIQYEATIHMVLRLRGGGGEAGRMGLAAAGKIKQKIYADVNTSKCYYKNCITIHLDIVNTRDYSQMFDTPLPDTPISFKTYKSNGYPWFALYDQELKSIKTEGKFDSIKSISKQDDFKELPMCTRCYENKINAEFILCQHLMCTECIQELVSESGTDEFICPMCKNSIKESDVIITSAIVDD